MATRPRKAIRDRMPFLFFTLSLCFFSFFYGICVWQFHVFPHRFVKRAFSEYREYARDLAKPSHLYPIRYDDPGVHIHQRQQISPGLTLLTTFWRETDWAPGIRLIDAEGKTLHHWTVNPREIWPISPHTDINKGQKPNSRVYIHGSYLFANGDVLFNLEYLGLTRIDACGKVVWKLPYRTHHSISRNDDGNFTVLGLKWITKGNERAQAFPGMQVPFSEEIILTVSPDGEVLNEISLLEALYASDYHELLWLYGPYTTGDVLHANDAELLSEELAPDFPMFTVGDILVSMRHLNAIAVLDRDGTVKWLDHGHFVQQHDPDFEVSGTIVVFDNQLDNSVTGEYLGGTRIMSIAPATSTLTQLYPTDSGQAFFSNAGGKHQILPNGNRLITEAQAARVFEISPTGELVWEWIGEPYDESLVPEVLEGTRYSMSADEVASWSCSE